MGAALAEVDGYVTETVYPSSYHETLNPAWTDDCLLRAGVRPPRYDAALVPRPFTLLDLGCGDALGLLLLAATHPGSRFIGVDAMPDHIAYGQDFAQRLGLSNVTLIAADFGQALERDDLGADYVVAQGVYSWVGPTAREQLLALFARNLPQGGAASMSYNALPGWASMLAFQRLIRQLALAGTGSTYDRFARAFEQLRGLADAGLSHIGKTHIELIEQQRTILPDKYFAHEYLHDSWQPQWSADVLARAAQHGLTLANSGRPERIREDFILRAGQRAELEPITDPTLRETLVDHFTACSFRCDIYVKGDLPRLTGEEAERARLAKLWMRRPGRADWPFEARTPAGKIRFDNPAAHALWDALADGPSAPAAVVDASSEFDAVDILNVLDALAVDHLIPVEPADPRVDADALNAALVDADGTTPVINASVTPHGPVRRT